MEGRELHFIAIGGAGMSGLALVCAGLGARVTGSDRAESSYLTRLRSAGIDARVGHDAAAVPAGADVVVSTAIAADNPELEIARSRGQRVLHRGELLAELTRRKRLIAVAGTHGKTTTTGMLVHALRALDADPAFFIGGELPGAGAEGGPANAGWGAGEWVVAEADESDGSFLELRPELALVTNVELDHHSRWGSLAELEEAFARFTAGAAAAVTAEDFDLSRPGPALELAVPGEHNVLNARAALAILELAGFELGAAAAALEGFPGIARRQELKGGAGGALIYDDYAHHPTEVAATLAALRELEPRRLIAVFQPHLLLADEGACRPLRRRPRRRRRDRRARRLRRPRAADRRARRGQRARRRPRRRRPRRRPPGLVASRRRGRRRGAPRPAGARRPAGHDRGRRRQQARRGAGR